MHLPFFLSMVFWAILSICCIISFGWFPGVWILYADALEHCVCSIFVGSSRPPMKMEQTECSETSAYKIQTPGDHPKERIWHSKHRESLKSRIIVHIHTLNTSVFLLSSCFSIQRSHSHKTLQNAPLKLFSVHIGYGHGWYMAGRQ